VVKATPSDALTIVHVRMGAGGHDLPNMSHICDEIRIRLTLMSLQDELRTHGIAVLSRKDDFGNCVLGDDQQREWRHVMVPAHVPQSNNTHTNTSSTRQADDDRTHR
jgi:hypothetical protein